MQLECKEVFDLLLRNYAGADWAQAILDVKFSTCTNEMLGVGNIAVQVIRKRPLHSPRRDVAQLACA